jgi:ABC-type siderophore export system fused ATPase/permease subunit
MKNINDEMLNKLIDNELNEVETKMIKDAIDKSPELKLKYSSLLQTDKILHTLKSETVSSDFTKKVLQKIQRQKALAKQQKYFLFAVLSLFGIIALGIVGFIFYQIISSSSPQSNQIVTTYSKDVGDYFSDLFGKKNISIFGSVLSFIMLVSGYFFYEYQKNSKKNFTH